MENIHTPECQAAYQKYEAAYQVWMEKWGSTCCQNCWGQGAFYDSYDPSPAGVSLSTGSVMDAEPCSDCTGREEDPCCPRCGSRNIDVEKETPCRDCHYNWGKNPDDMRPEWPGCGCEDAYYDRQEAEYNQEMAKREAEYWQQREQNAQAEEKGPPHTVLIAPEATHYPNLEKLAEEENREGGGS